MSTSTDQAATDFSRATRDAHNLVWLHRNSQTGRGRRHRQPSMNRAAVTLTVAAWQAFVQDIVVAVLTEIEIPYGQPGHGQFRVIKIAAKNSIRRFNTPNAKNSLDLMYDVGFDPTTGWSFVVGSPPRKYKVQRIRKEIDGWLEVRHKIAHGAPLPESELVSGRTKVGASLHRQDAERCIAFFETLVGVTRAAAATQFP